MHVTNSSPNWAPARLHLTRRQLAFEAALKHVGMGTLAITMLVLLALVTAAGGTTPIGKNAGVAHFGNKTASGR